eukprot:8138549-Karenia_brevis.AAC.1
MSQQHGGSSTIQGSSTIHVAYISICTDNKYISIPTCSTWPQEMPGLVCQNPPEVLRAAVPRPVGVFDI